MKHNIIKKRRADKTTFHLKLDNNGKTKFEFKAICDIVVHAKKTKDYLPSL